MTQINIEYVSPDKINPAPYNPRTIDDEALKRLAKLLDAHGVVDPLIVRRSDGLLIGGHQRLKANELRQTPDTELPVVYLDDISDAKAKALNIALNNTKTQGIYDYPLLNQLLIEIDTGEIDVPELTGFSEVEIGEMISIGDETVHEDEPPAVQEKAISQTGDLWMLGEHRLLCGDSTKAEDVERLMGGEKADMVFTSPPYNANTKTGDGDIFGPRKAKDMYHGKGNDNKSSSGYILFTKDVLKRCFEVTDGYIFWNVSYNAKSKFEYIKQIEDHLEFLVEQVCWKKSSTIPFKGMLMRDWEPIYVFSTNKQNLNVKNVTSNYWDINNTNSQAENHKACFPVGLPEKGISLVNENSGVVYEPFCGSGSTLIACEQTNRKCYGMEIDEHYCDVIIRRWQNLTGQDAMLDGKTFAEVEAER